MTDDELRAKVNEVAAAIAVGVESTWHDLYKQYPRHTFFAFVLSTVDGMVGVGASANSLQNHQGICQENGLEPETPDEEYYRWGVCEWGEMEYVGTKAFDPANTLMAQLYDAAGDDFDSYRKAMIQAMIDGLARASDAGVFGAGEARAGITLFVTIYDSFDQERVEDESARALNPAAVYEQFSRRFAVTEQEVQDEQDAQQARYDALSKLGPDQQAERCLNDYVEHLLNPEAEATDQFLRGEKLFDMMVRVGKPMVCPIIASLADGIDTPIGNEGYAMMKVITEVNPGADKDLHHRLAALLIRYCEYNNSRTQWQVTPFHIAKFLYDQFTGVYPYPSMEGHNALRDHERFVEIARQYVV